MKPRVIVISIDGFASFYWRDPAVRAPVLRRLAERGALAAGMETVFPSTVPSARLWRAGPTTDVMSSTL